MTAAGRLPVRDEEVVPRLGELRRDLVFRLAGADAHFAPLGPFGGPEPGGDPRPDFLDFVRVLRDPEDREGTADAPGDALGARQRLGRSVHGEDSRLGLGEDPPSLKGHVHVAREHAVRRDDRIHQNAFLSVRRGGKDLPNADRFRGSQPHANAADASGKSLLEDRSAAEPRAVAFGASPAGRPAPAGPAGERGRPPDEAGRPGSEGSSCRIARGLPRSVRRERCPRRGTSRRKMTAAGSRAPRPSRPRGAARGR